MTAQREASTAQLAVELAATDEALGRMRRLIHLALSLDAGNVLGPHLDRLRAQAEHLASTAALVQEQFGLRRDGDMVVPLDWDEWWARNKRAFVKEPLPPK
jgi:hypothetical protein